MEIIIGRKGNQAITITDPTVSGRHCSLSDNGNGTYTLRHLSTTNHTYINGHEVLECNVYPDDIIMMGNFRASVRDLVGIKPAPQPGPKPGPTPGPKPGPIPEPQPEPQQTISLTHLQAVWDNYDAAMTDIQLRQRKIGLLRSLTPIFTLGGAAIMGVLGFFDVEIGRGFTAFLGLFAVIGVTIIIFSFFLNLNDRSIEERKAATRYLQDNYTCPHCGRFLGMIDYHVLPRNMKACPNCKAKYTY